MTGLMAKALSRIDAAKLSILKRIHARNSRERAIWLVSAALFHLVLTTLIFAAGRSGLLPGIIGKDGFIRAFATDSYGYQAKALALLEILSTRGAGAWLHEPGQLIEKLTSIEFALFGPMAGPTILSVEPLNLLSYVAILYIIFGLGAEVFDRRTGRLAAGIVAVWPSFLLHTTQILKDPLLIAAFLALVWIVARVIQRPLEWRFAAELAVAGALIMGLIVVLRPVMEVILLGMITAAAILFAARQMRDRKFPVPNTAVLSLLIALTVAGPAYTLNKVARGAAQQRESAALGPGERIIPPVPGLDLMRNPQGASLWSRLRTEADRSADLVNYFRMGFVEVYPDAASNIDARREFHTFSGLVAYLPRAMAIGFFAPFPSWWLEAGGSVGVTGRILAGLETLGMYIFEAFAVAAMWRSRERLGAWLLLITATIGVTTLGLIVINLGALYRMRYCFWMLVIVVGAAGIARMSEREAT